MIKFLKQNKKNKSGFTLVETLVAVFIFSISLTVMFAVLASGISDLNFSKKKTTAQYLAQEGIEYVRNIRDTHVFFDDPSTPQTGWGHFLAEFSGCNANANANGCFLAPPNSSVSVCQAGGMGCAHLKYTSSTGSYNYDSNGTDSGFVRIIKVERGTNANDAKVLSTVYWVSNGTNHSASFSEDLYNWAE